MQLSADVRGFQREMQKAQGITNRQARAIERRARDMNRNLSAIGQQAARSLIAPLAGIGAALGTREIMAYADAWTQAGNLIRAASQAAGVQTRSLQELRKGADDARTSFQEYTNLYANLIRAASGVAKSEEEIALATNLVSKAMVAGGASTQEQAAAILQLGQALTSGVLQGDELRSLRENAPVIAQAIADEFQVTIGGLKDLGAEGALTADRVFRAIINAQGNIEAQFAQTNATIADGFTSLKNAVIEYIGTAAEANGVTNAINSVLSALAGNLNSVAAAAAAAAVVLLNQFVVSIARAAAAQAVLVATNPFLAIAAAAGAAAFAIGAFGDEITPIEGDLANLHDYAGAVWDGIKEDAVLSANQIKDGFLEVINAITGAMGSVEATWADVLDFIKGEFNNLIGLLMADKVRIETIFSTLPEVIAEKAIDAMNGMISAINSGLQEVARLFNSMVDTVNSIPSFARATMGLGIAPLSRMEPEGFEELENKYRGAGEAAGKAMEEGVAAALNRDYAGEFMGKIGDDIRQRANDRAFVRTIEAAIARTGTSGTGSTEGYGGGTGIPAPGSGTGSGSGRKGRASRERANELEREIQQIKERTAALRAETEVRSGLNPLLNDYDYAITKARATQELLTAAQRAGVQVTDEVRASIDALAETYAQATVESGKLAEAQDKIRQHAEEMAAMGKEALGGFISDLARGKSAADALADALGRIADRLINMGIDRMFQGAGAGGGGGLFGGRIIPGILHQGGTAGVDGYGHGRSFPASTWAGARRMHSGGVVGGLMPNEVPTILKRGETVTPAGGGGGSMDVRVYVDQDGNWQAAVERISGRVAANAAAGAVRSYDRNLPARMRKISGDERFMG